ncbi:hypothetical protein K488DRAFT_73503 [Vararia minispora EC-137]|uniref:Uncharacterized protein n=1 Tax=Vararia minispora EC-137 TaxID=1314806 RepID=A0ACB8QB46_9AGAM|nr:hypothetical protein K488DRAFT_73503 [Vararia minispora EC-137]
MNSLIAIDEYRKYLYIIGRGHALWSPSPQQIDGVRQPSVRIGDIGYIYDGRWTFLFNIHLASGAEGQAARLPPGFRPLEKSGVSWSLLPRSTQWSVRSGSSRCISVGLSDSDATIAYIGEADEETVTMHVQRRYVKYALHNLQNWKRFFVEQRMDLNISDLIIVTACTRATSWTNSVRISASSDLNLGVQASLNSLANIELTYENRAHVDLDVLHNSGPTYRSAAESVTLDQCLFLKGYKLSPIDQIHGILRSSLRPRWGQSHSRDAGRALIHPMKPSGMYNLALSNRDRATERHGLDLLSVDASSGPGQEGMQGTWEERQDLVQSTAIDEASSSNLVSGSPRASINISPEKGLYDVLCEFRPLMPTRLS